MNLLGLPAHVIAALGQIPRLFDRLDSIDTSTRQLDQIRAAIETVSQDTRELASLREDMRRVAAATEPLGAVAAATDVLPGMDDRMATIEAAMPVLVEVQQHLARLPETMETLAGGITNLTVLLERLLTSLDRLDENVTHLDSTIRPLGSLADRLPGGGRRTANG
jgi:ABC-type transporter Mla subunit MlaD